MQAICVVVKAEGLAFRSSIVVDLVRIANRKMHWREKGFLYIFFPFGLWPQAKSLESHVPTVFENQGKSLIASKASYDFTQITDTLFSIAEKKIILDVKIQMRHFCPISTLYALPWIQFLGTAHSFSSRWSWRLEERPSLERGFANFGFEKTSS